MAPPNAVFPWLTPVGLLNMRHFVCKVALAALAALVALAVLGVLGLLDY